MPKFQNKSTREPCAIKFQEESKIYKPPKKYFSYRSLKGHFLILLQSATNFLPTFQKNLYPE